MTGGQKLMLGTAAFAMLWAIARAVSQSITIDEANAYLSFVWPPQPLQWYPANNNHLLNTVLMRLFASVFGTSHLTLRAPALIGAAIYIAACYRLCRLLSRSISLQWPLFVCLVYNPFVFDYLVAARGYGLAIGLLLSAVFYAAAWHLGDQGGQSRSLEVSCAVSSLCIGLSFVANFAFAFVNLASIAAVFVCACLARPGLTPTRRRLPACGRILTACVVPGSLVTLFLASSVLLTWPKGELWHGATSLREMFSSIIEASLYQLNPELVNPLLYPFLEPIQPYSLLLLGATFVVGFVFLLLKRRSLASGSYAAGLWKLAVTLTAILAVTLLTHWICFRVFHLLLPKNRTGLFIAPLSILVIGAIAAVPALSRVGGIVRGSMIASLMLLAVQFLFCLRLSYFKEWQWDADVKDLYSVLACLNQTHGERDVVSHWKYQYVINYYVAASGHETIPRMTAVAEDPYRADAQVYVLNWASDQEVVRDRRLKVVYRGRRTDGVVALAPELAEKLASSPCLLRPQP